MRFTPVLLAVLLAAAAFAADTELGHVGAITPGISPDTDADIVSQPFDFGTLQNGLSCSSQYTRMMADDFTPATAADLAMVDIWMIYSSSQASTIKFQARNDNSGSPGSTVEWETDCSNLTHTDTGFSQWGYDLIYTEAVIDPGSYFSPTPGVCYWFVVQTQSTGNDFWLCTNQTWAEMSYFSDNNGDTWTSSQGMWGTAYEQFMVLMTPTALQRSTWADIKALF